MSATRRSGSDVVLDVLRDAAVGQRDTRSSAPEANAAGVHSTNQTDIDTPTKWMDSGAAEGNSKDAPAPLKFVTGWNIGQPNLVLEMTNDFRVPAKGALEYTYVIPNGMTENRWVRSDEVRLGNRKVVHHVIAFAREPNSKWLRDAKPGEPFVPTKRSAEGTPVQEDTTLIDMIPRGRTLEYRAVFPNGETKELLRVPPYDFNWQLSYRPAAPIDLRRAAGSSVRPGSTTRPTTRATPMLTPRYDLANSVVKR